MEEGRAIERCGPPRARGPLAGMALRRKSPSPASARSAAVGCPESRLARFHWARAATPWAPARFSRRPTVWLRGGAGSKANTVIRTPDSRPHPSPPPPPTPLPPSWAAARLTKLVRWEPKLPREELMIEQGITRALEIVRRWRVPHPALSNRADLRQQTPQSGNRSAPTQRPQRELHPRRLRDGCIRLPFETSCFA